jgi:hypothetical protein
MMTNGPAARVGGILPIPFVRPRRRADVLEHPNYFRLRETLTSFLEDQELGPAPRDADQSLPAATATQAPPVAVSVG